MTEMQQAKITIVSGREGVGRAYQDEQLAEEYLESRYEHDGLLNSIHQAQMRILHRFLGPRGASPILEVACGPARITAELTEVQRGVAVDQSEAMLRIAERRLTERNIRGWKLLRGDAFDLQFNDSQFDVVMSFKLLRHFDRPHRQQLLKEFRRVLKPGGFLLFDVANAPAYKWLYYKWGLEQTWIDDFHLTADVLRREMEENGFRLVHLHSIHRPIVGQYVLFTSLRSRVPNWAFAWANRALNSLPFGMPLEWLAVCRRA